MAGDRGGHRARIGRVDQARVIGQITGSRRLADCNDLLPINASRRFVPGSVAMAVGRRARKNRAAESRLIAAMRASFGDPL